MEFRSLIAENPANRTAIVADMVKNGMDSTHANLVVDLAMQALDEMVQASHRVATRAGEPEAVILALALTMQLAQTEFTMRGEAARVFMAGRPDSHTMTGYAEVKS